jgi:hypothetical protein
MEIADFISHRIPKNYIHKRCQAGKWDNGKQIKRLISQIYFLKNNIENDECQNTSFSFSGTEPLSSNATRVFNL